MFWVISVYFNIRNTLPKSGTFLLGHPVYIWESGCSTPTDEKEFTKPVIVRTSYSDLIFFRPRIIVCYITILYMFRALTCPSSGGQIVLSQHLVSSLSVQCSTESDDTRCCDNTICSPEDGYVNPRNMSRNVM